MQRLKVSGSSILHELDHKMGQWTFISPSFYLVLYVQYI